jgi:TolB protein
VSNRLGNWTVWVMNPDGSDKKQVTSESYVSGWPSWSPDGSRIAYWSYDSERSDIWVIHLVNGSRTNLTCDAGYEGIVKWSPSNDLVAYSSNKTGVWHVRVVNASSGEQWAVTEHEFDHFLTDWRPDGEAILYWGMDTQTWEVTIRGSVQRQITHGGGFEISGVYSPDMTQIAYLHFSNERYRLWLMDRDGSNQTWVALEAGTEGDRTHSFHPHLNLILFWGYTVVPYREPEERDRIQADIYVVNFDGGNVSQLTTLGSEDMFPSWSPDGTSILFESDRRGNVDLFVLPYRPPEQTLRIASIEAVTSLEIGEELELNVSVLYSFGLQRDVAVKVIDMDSL